MDLIERSDHNFTYRGPSDAIKDAKGYLDPEDKSFWLHFKPTEQELKELNDGHHLCLGIYAMPIPPVSLSVIPYIEGEEHGVQPFRQPGVRPEEENGTDGSKS